MNISRLASGFVVTLLVVIILAGFLFLQGEINSSKNANSPFSTPLPTATTNPKTQSNATYNPTGPAASSITTTTSYGGATLVCNGSLSYGSDSGGLPVFIINSLSITNIGSENATISEIEIQTYYPNGTQALDITKFLDASGMYSTAMPKSYWIPSTILPGQTISNFINGRPGSYEVFGVRVAQDTLASYTITPLPY